MNFEGFPLDQSNRFFLFRTSSSAALSRCGQPLQLGNTAAAAEVPSDTTETMVNRVIERRKLRNGKGKHVVRDVMSPSWTRDKALDTRTLLAMPTKVSLGQGRDCHNVCCCLSD